MAERLAGRTAVVTGSGSGIGRATARKLAAEGAHVVVNDLVPERADETVALITQSRGSAQARAGDVTDPAFVGALVDQTVADRGRLDVFHSNAGAGLAQGPLLSIADDGWRADITLNLNAMFFCVREALRVMVPQGRGSIVCTSSAAGVGAVPGTGPYGSAKAGILALVRSAAVEYGSSGVRVNAVVPGSVQTPAFLEWIGSEERLARYASQIPMGRMARPEDIADAVAWLASDEASYITGIALPVDGGATAALQQPHVD